MCLSGFQGLLQKFREKDEDDATHNCGEKGPPTSTFQGAIPSDSMEDWKSKGAGTGALKYVFASFIPRFTWAYELDLILALTYARPQSLTPKSMPVSTP
ncbi:hypothetical protein KM043_009679 [Ampulex compressa]|nr:hypothetical protein KM043_009679 [Ampulex compressa]